MKKPKPTTIDANSHAGRTLLALRAGPMTTIELADRFPGGHKLTEMARKGFVEKVDDRFQLTASGRAACPLRNPLAAAVASAPVAAQHARVVKQTVIKPALQPDPKSNHGGTMANELTINNTKTPIFKTRAAIEAAIAGIDKDHAITREDLIVRTNTDVERVTVINVIKKMCVESTVIGAFGHTAKRRFFDIRTLKVEPATADGTSSSVQKSAQAIVDYIVGAPDNETRASKPASGDTEADEVEFSIYNDGRLAIIDGDEVFVIPPDATRRLGYFLGCLETNTWPPRLDPHAALTPATA